MSEMAPHALEIPEVLRGVFEFLESDRKTLCCAIRVNKSWAEEGLNIIWRTMLLDGAGRLGSIPRHRRQFYANRIRTWEMDQSPFAYQYLIRKLKFPRLKKFGLCLTRENFEINCQLVPTLEKFTLYKYTDEAEDYLRELPERCPNLRKFCVGNSHGKLDFDRFDQYLKEFSNLQAFDLNGMSDDTMTDDVFVHLASLPLYELRMRKIITSDMVDMASQRLWPNSLFQAVHYVEFKMEWLAAAKLLPSLRTLNRLELTLQPGATHHEVFQAIGTLTELRKLHLSVGYQTDKSLSREEFLALGNLHELRDLAILAGGLLELGESVTGDDLVSFFSSFPRADSIYIDAFHTSLVPSPATTALAMASTQLRYLTLKTIWDMTFIESSTSPLFPNIESINYQTLHYDNALPEESGARSDSIATLSRYFLKQCPKLGAFTSWGRDEDQFTEELGSAVWKLLHPKRGPFP